VAVSQLSSPATTVLARFNQIAARVFYDRKLRPAPVEGISPPPTAAEAATSIQRLEATRLLLTMLCLGDKINETVVLRALPDSFSAFLSFRPSYNPNPDPSPESPVAAAGSGAFRGGFSTLAAVVDAKLKLSSGSQSVKDRQLGSSSSVYPTGEDGRRAGDVAPMSTTVNTAAYNRSIAGLTPPPGCTAALADGGFAARTLFARKIGSMERGSWHVLTAVLSEQLENPRMVCSLSNSSLVFIASATCYIVLWSLLILKLPAGWWHE
jgi:hypothetical protein